MTLCEWQAPKNICSRFITVGLLPGLKFAIDSSRVDVKIPASQNSGQSKFRPTLKNFLTFYKRLYKKQKKANLDFTMEKNQNCLVLL
jgi:hypothetical protein